MPGPLPNLAVFASNLRALCSRANLTQSQVAEIAGAAQSTVGSWQRGESSPDVAELARLCRHFGVAADYLIGMCDYPSGLAPDSWIVDVDAMEAAVPGSSWAAKVPRRVRVVDFNELLRLEEQFGTRGKTRKSKGKGGAGNGAS